MSNNYQIPTDAEMDAMLRHAHVMRAQATRQMGQAFVAYVKNRIVAVKNALTPQAHKAA